MLQQFLKIRLFETIKIRSTFEKHNLNFWGLTLLDNLTSNRHDSIIAKLLYIYCK